MISVVSSSLHRFHVVVMGGYFLVSVVIMVVRGGYLLPRGDMLAASLI
jgi:hypothetical protein